MAEIIQTTRRSWGSAWLFSTVSAAHNCQNKVYCFGCISSRGRGGLCIQNVRRDLPSYSVGTSRSLGQGDNEPGVLLFSFCTASWFCPVIIWLAQTTRWWMWTKQNGLQHCGNGSAAVVAGWTRTAHVKTSSALPWWPRAQANARVRPLALAF